MKSALLLALGTLLMNSPVRADEIDNHYREAIDQIKTQLNRQGMGVTKIVIDSKTPKGGTLIGHIIFELEGIQKRVNLFVPLAVAGIPFGTSEWVEQVSLKWNEVAANLALFLPENLKSADKVLTEIDLEAKARLKTLVMIADAMKTARYQKGSYLRILIAELDTSIKKQLGTLGKIEYLDAKGVKVEILLSPPGAAQEFVYKDQLELMKQATAHLDSAIFELEQRRTHFREHRDTTQQAAAANQEAFEAQKNKHLSEKAKLFFIEKALIVVLDLQSKLTGDQASIQKAEAAIVEGLIGTLKDLEKAIKIAGEIKTHKGSLLTPQSSAASAFRKSILKCEALMDRLSGLGMELAKRNFIIEVGAEIYDLQERISNYRNTPQGERTKAQSLDLFTSSQNLGFKVSQAVHALTLEEGRLQELKKLGQLSATDSLRLRGIQFELEALGVQMKEAHKLLQYSRSTLRNR